MKNIKKTLKQCDSIPLPDKKKVLASLGCYEEKEVRKEKEKNHGSFHMLTPLYAGVALFLVMSIGFMIYNYDKLFVEGALPVGSSESETEFSETTPPLSTESTVTENTPNNVITQEEAEKIALERVGGGVVADSETEKEDGIKIYEIEVFYEDVEYDVEIDIVTGEILKISPDFSLATVPLAEAKSIALAQTNGGEITDIELDTEKGILVYEFEIVIGFDKYDVTVDATTGEVIEVELDD